ncbi:Unknown protein sequence [Pseudomonas syringae pv. cilantro]|uniref:Uncharacterized protein n=2 Tax=Pseudomonas syringae group TaxID=136849 RepID=A0A0N1JNK8_PSESX|nr:Unknown protein sequence [Pseudomonas syringae pv. cilantro]RMN06433.1 hypothetical protein ALQ65_200332 [Pseudomonas syringae pv. coriandricola]
MKDIDFFAAPGVLRQPEPGLGQLARAFGRKGAVQVGTDHRKQLGGLQHIELQSVDDLTQQCSGFDQLDFDGGLGNRQGLVVDLRDALDADFLRLYLDHCVGLIHRRGEHRIAQPEQKKQADGAQDQCFVIEQQPQDSGQIDPRVLVVIQGRMVHDGHLSGHS